MIRQLPNGGRRGTLAAAAATAALAAAAIGVLLDGSGWRTGPPSPPVMVTAPYPAARTGPALRAPAAPAATGTDFGPVLPASTPTGLDIPAIGVHSRRLVALGRNRDGSLQVPADFAVPGWYAAGPTPGQFGPAVIAGHVDSFRGPAVFFRLGQLTPGATVVVSRSDGSIARFVVDRVVRFAKARFPTAEVYGNTTSRAELRLITCGGAFDRSTRTYVDNIVVFAHLSG